MSFFRKLVKKNRTQLIVIGLGIIAFVALAVASSEYSALTRTSVLTEPRDSVSCTCFCSAEGEVHLPMCRNDQVVCTADLQKYTLTLNGPFKNYIAAADACAALNYNRGCDGFRRDPKNPSARIHDNGVLNLCTTTNIPTVTPAPTPTSTPKPTPTPTVTPTPSPEPPCVVEAGGICVKSTISSGAGKGCYVAGGSLTISLTAELTEAKSEKEFGSARLYPINFYDEEGAYIPYLIRPNFDPFAFFYGLSGRIWIPQVFGSKTYTLTGTVNEDIPRATVLRWSFDVKTGFHNENAASYVLEVPGCTQEKAVKTPTCEIRHITMTGERAEEGIESSERNQWNGNTPKTLDAEAMKQRLTQKSREFCFAISLEEQKKICNINDRSDYWPYVPIRDDRGESLTAKLLDGPIAPKSLYIPFRIRPGETTVARSDGPLALSLGYSVFARTPCVVTCVPEQFSGNASIACQEE